MDDVRPAVTVTIVSGNVEHNMPLDDVLAALTNEQIRDACEERGFDIHYFDNDETDRDTAEWVDDDIRAALLRGAIPDALLMMERRMPEIDRAFSETVARYFKRFPA